ncbi:ribosomal protein L11 methyltransferase [Flavobacteriaceae bacterium UJ101]|nr:ribosomal protein L11 methyltransferase [Flavobacteriaceae bacterium UJ101]
MDYNYIEYTFTVTPLQPTTEILIAELALIEFDSFSETDTGLQAYVLAEKENEDAVKNLQIIQNKEFAISYTRKVIEPTNWNEEWEKNFDPIDVEGQCYVRATFHDSKPTYPYEIVIDPKMSFGTGHHETTYMMIQQILHHDMTKKQVLDMGCGTAILAMLAKMKGADFVKGIDIDEWAIENAIENTKRNSLEISLALGTAKLLGSETFDIIFANINRNILLQDATHYIKVLNPNGDLFLSGFYLEDLPIIRQGFEKNGVNFVSHIEKNNWVAAHFKK